MIDSKASKNAPSKEMDKKTQEEIKKRLEQLKSKVESFKKKLIKKQDKNLLGICLLPPEKFEDIIHRLKAENLKESELKKRIKEEKDKINLLILLDDQDTKSTKEKIELIKKVDEDSKKIAEEVDKSIKPQCMLMSEVREACYDGKYEVLQLLSTGVHIYDKKDVLGAIKVSEIHKSMVLKQFEKYIVSYIAVGSLFRGDASSHDIDIAIIVDDTDVKRMSRTELRDKLMGIIRAKAIDARAISGVEKEFHIQVYILTDFWDNIRDATPVIFTFLRDGIPLYDRGVFMPQKLLLNMGKIKPSPEAIDRHMDVGETLLDIGKKKLMNIATENIYYAAINPSQSALMLQGYPPSIPRETIRLLEEVFVKEKKLMTMKDVNVIKNAFKVYKDFEHGKIKEISGKEIDLMMKDVSAYVKKIKGIVRELEKASLKEGKTKLLNSINTSLTNLMVVEGLSKTKTELKNNFSKLVRKGHFTKEEQTLLQKTMEGVKKSSSKEELNKYRRESALIRKKILNHIQRDKEKELKKARIKIKYDGKMGELYVLDKIVYMVGVIDKGIKAVTKAKLMPNGGLGMPRPSTVEELEKVISEIKIDKNTFIKEALFEDLKKIFGSDVEVMIGE